MPANGKKINGLILKNLIKVSLIVKICMGEIYD